MVWAVVGRLGLLNFLWGVEVSFLSGKMYHQEEWVRFWMKVGDRE